MNPMILMVDNQTENLEKLSDYLKEHQFQNFDRSHSAEEALKLGRKKHYDVIITEMALEKEESGFDIVNRYQGLSPLLIVFTQHFNLEILKKCMRHRVYNYINKESENAYQEVVESIQEGLKSNYVEAEVSRDSIFIDENFEEFMEKYPGEDVAVLDEIVVGHNQDYKKLKKEMANQYPFAKVSIISIPEKEEVSID